MPPKRLLYGKGRLRTGCHFEQHEPFFAVFEQHSFSQSAAADGCFPAQQLPCPGQQHSPVTQQLSAFFTVAAVVFDLAAGSQQLPCPGQQQSPVTQQPAADSLGVSAEQHDPSQHGDPG